jgi:hypothetical protein
VAGVFKAGQQVVLFLPARAPTVVARSTTARPAAQRHARKPVARSTRLAKR